MAISLPRAPPFSTEHAAPTRDPGGAAQAGQK